MTVWQSDKFCMTRNSGFFNYYFLIVQKTSNSLVHSTSLMKIKLSNNIKMSTQIMTWFHKLWFGLTVVYCTCPDLLCYTLNLHETCYDSCRFCNNKWKHSEDCDHPRKKNQHRKNEMIFIFSNLKIKIFFFCVLKTIKPVHITQNENIKYNIINCLYSFCRGKDGARVIDLWQDFLFYWS